MYVGFINVHPVTLPLGNEMMFAISNAVNHLVMVYASIKPDLLNLIEVIDLI